MKIDLTKDIFSLTVYCDDSADGLDVSYPSSNNIAEALKPLKKTTGINAILWRNYVNPYSFYELFNGQWVLNLEQTLFKTEVQS